MTGPSSRVTLVWMLVGGVGCSEGCRTGILRTGTGTENWNYMLLSNLNYLDIYATATCPSTPGYTT